MAVQVIRLKQNKPYRERENNNEKLNAETPTNKQPLKVATVKVWQCI